MSTLPEFPGCILSATFDPPLVFDGTPERCELNNRIAAAVFYPGLLTARQMLALYAALAPCPDWLRPYRPRLLPRRMWRKEAR